MMKNKYLLTFAFSTGLALILSLLFHFGFFYTWSQKLTDNLFLQSDPDTRIMIIAIDNKSLQTVGRWPWDRSVHAAILDRISSGQPAVIGYDVNFPEVSNEKSDQEFARAIKNAGNVILSTGADLTLQKKKISAEKIMQPLVIFLEAAAGAGLVNTPTEGDGVFRKLPIDIFFKTSESEKIMTFAELISRKYADKDGFDLPTIQKDKQGRMIVNFVGKAGSFDTISAADVLDNNFDPKILSNKIVLIGATAPDLQDYLLVPSAKKYPMSGVEVHANSIWTIISGKHLSYLDPFWQTLIFFLIAWFLSLCLLAFRFLVSTIISVALSILYFVMALLIIDQGIILEIFYVISLIILVYLFAVIVKYVFEAREKHFIKGTFGRYVSPEIISEILANPKKLKLGGDKKELTIMFSDIRGFTSISESLKPEELVAMLNRYLSVMTDIVLEHSGVVDKFIGDAIMAFWGAPLDRRDHAALACQTALDMVKKLKENKEIWQKEFGVELNIGIGMNTGELIIGNLGSDKRFDYTVIGDSVNLASRLEGMTKLYGVKIVVSEFTQDQAKNDFVFRLLDKVAVKGKSQPVCIYELIARKTEISEEQTALVKSFYEAIAMYQDRKWDEAINAFTGISRRFPEDMPASIYLERSRHLKDSCPDDWDGVFHATSK